MGMVARQDKTKSENDKAEGRADFLKRFFAVAISVGFAAKLIEMNFLLHLDFSDSANTQQLLLLFISISIIMGSWDFYFTSIKDRPLYDRGRFFLDIFIVSGYILLLSSIDDERVFCRILCGILFLYYIWDILTAAQFPQEYQISSLSIFSIFTLSTRGLYSPIPNEAVKLTPFISLWWFLVFVAITSSIYITPKQPYILITCIALTYWSFRTDQERPFRLSKRFFISILLCIFVHIDALNASLFISYPLSMLRSLL